MAEVFRLVNYYNLPRSVGESVGSCFSRLHVSEEFVTFRTCHRMSPTCHLGAGIQRQHVSKVMKVSVLCDLLLSSWVDIPEPSHSGIPEGYTWIR